MKTLIRNATVVFAQESRRTSILIEDSRIADIDPAIQMPVDETVDAVGLHLLPGMIDDHVHFREPGPTHKEDLRHGSRGCAKGGVTTFLDMPNTRPSTTTVERLHEKLALAARQSLVNYGFYMGATENNLEHLLQAKRTPGIKIYIGSSTGDLLVDDQEVLERIFAETALPIAAHCEDEATIQANKQHFAGSADVADHSKIRDHQAALIATRRAVDLALRHSHRFHLLHASTAAETALCDDHHHLLTTEVCPHHLYFNVEDYPRLGTRIQMNPSVKTAEDNRQLWRALQSGGVQVIASDHAPHTLAEKQQPYPGSPSGVPGVENSLPLLLDQVHSGRCTLQQVAHWMSTGPARVWDLVNKGRIARGYDADLVLVDLEKRAMVRDEQQHTKCRWSPWHGITLTGWPVRTWVMGHTVYAAGKFDESRRGSEAEFDHARGGYWT
ncbi:MAG: dihydroorotase [Planctomycetota bacterium]